MAARRAAGSLLAFLLALSGAAGCGGSVAGKAGAGDRPRRPLVLTMALPSASNPGAMRFVDDVRRLTRGTLRIRLAAGYATTSTHASTAVAEQRTAARLQTGQVQLAWLAAWAWETQRVRSFRALQAPLLIGDVALLRRVVTSTIARDMLRGAEDRGVVGLGLVPDGLRRLVARDRRLVSPAAFAGARILVRSPGMARIVRALGATPIPDQGGSSGLALQQRGVDAADTELQVVIGDGYSEAARYVSANLVLFPRADIIDINRHVFDQLTRAEQQALREAARRSVDAVTRGLAEQEAAMAEVLCERGMRFVRASREQLAQLAAALRPVTARLERDRQTRTFIERIAALKRQTPPGPPLAIPRGCAA
jgi:TRAP-type C4-dicarboxylate transport system substrate-binding protein